MSYSFETSYPAYIDNKEGKKSQCEKVLDVIKQGANNLLMVHDMLPEVPQAVISARVGALNKDNLTYYAGYVFYKGRKRKQIKLVNKQMELF